MELQFNKYQGTGNDFIILDNRKGNYNDLNQIQIATLCDRHFGIGADGLMLLENAVTPDADFKMVYYNADGKQSSMCGNGGRCMVAFANKLGIVEGKANFEAIDGMHFAEMESLDFIELKMNDVLSLQKHDADFILNTGSPHYVQYHANAKEIDVYAEGKKIRDSSLFLKDGINVNFITTLADKTLFVATFERGVEAETLSCGTGVVASALVHVQNRIGGNYVRISTKGGTLLVKCVNQNGQHFTDVWLCGPAKFVYQGIFVL